MQEFGTLWDLLQTYPRDYAVFEPAFSQWTDGGNIQGIGTVTSCFVGTGRSVISISVQVSPPEIFDDGGWNSEDDGWVGGTRPDLSPGALTLNSAYKCIINVSWEGFTSLISA